jgi:hypothetical protein
MAEVILDILLDGVDDVTQGQSGRNARRKRQSDNCRFTYEGSVSKSAFLTP